MITYKVTVDVEGTKRWYLNGKRHRENGPAIEYADGGKSWWINGRLHREDGPAVELADGCEYWWINGVEYTKKEWKKETKKL